MSSELGSGGRVNDVRGIVHFSEPACEISDASDGEYSVSSSSVGGFSSSNSLSGSGGFTKGLEFVNRIRINRQIAFTASKMITTLHLAFSPLRFAIISRSNSVYWTHDKVMAVFLYVGLLWQ